MLGLFERHKERLDKAVETCRTRGYWSAFPEAPSGKLYGATAAADGQAAFEARLNRPFGIDQPTAGERIGAEVSPYGFPLGITYPAPDIAGMIEAAEAATPGWRGAEVEGRLGVCLEILDRLNKRSFELAHAVMHTTGQGFVMAFQAGGPHAQDRALEALALSYAAMERVPARALWEKPAGRDKVERFEKRYAITGRGIGLVIGCSTFPTWNSYPALFANLACGNPVIVKPHPRAVLPFAITVEIAREVLAEVGIEPGLVQLAVDTEGAPIAQTLATHPKVKLVDFTGSGDFGDWLEANVRQAQVYTEKAGVNSIVVHSTGDYQGMLRNLAFSLSLYSGQMCTTPQNLLVPAAGIATEEGHKTFGEVAQDLVTAIDKLLGDPDRAAEVLGAIHSPGVLERIEGAQTAAGERVLRRSEALTHPKFPGATVRSPLLVGTTLGSQAEYRRELFGPVSFLIAVPDINDAIDEAADAAEEKGAVTAAIYSTDRNVIGVMETAMVEAGVALSVNLHGGTYVNQSAAYSDYHVTGANPAGNASLTDEAFVTTRFRVVQRRMPANG